MLVCFCNVYYKLYTANSALTQYRCVSATSPERLLYKLYTSSCALTQYRCVSGTSPERLLCYKLYTTRGDQSPYTYTVCVSATSPYNYKVWSGAIKKRKNASPKNEISDSLEQLTVNVTWKTNYSNNILHSKRTDML